MIVLFTDFGLSGPYVGQMKAVLLRQAPDVPVVDLFADAPRCNPRAASYLLAAYSREFPLDTVFLAVVDPGVGSEQRRAAVVRAQGRWYVGPDNGLFNMVVQRARSASWWDIDWLPSELSNSFHGRDLFAPIAATIATGGEPPGRTVSTQQRIVPGWPEDLPEVVYVDHFGNAITGMRASRLGERNLVVVEGRALGRGRTFSSVAVGEPFWYENSNGLVEIAVNRGSAAELLDLRIGTPVEIR